MSDDLLDRLIMWPATQGWGDGLDASYVSRLMTEAANRLAAQEARASRPDVERVALANELDAVHVRHYTEGAFAIVPVDLRDRILAALATQPGDCCRRMVEAAAKACDAVESPFDEHTHAPENCAFYQATEACENAILALAPPAPENAGGGDA